jgi:hypothetical protein
MAADVSLRPYVTRATANRCVIGDREALVLMLPVLTCEIRLRLQKRPLCVVVIVRGLIGRSSTAFAFQ